MCVHVPGHMCGSQRTTFRSLSSAFCRFLGVKPLLSSTLTHPAILLGLSV